MGRGGRKRDRDAPERRCIATGEIGPTDRLLRFVLSPDGVAVPDVASKLPGRGAWLTADRRLVDQAVKKRLFSRAFRQPVQTPEDLTDLLEDLVAKRLIEMISLARKAGQAVTGAEKVRAHLTGGHSRVLVQASDGSEDGKGKLARLAAAQTPAVPRVEILTAQELGLAFGREFAIHASLDAGGFARKVCAEAVRLQGLRGTQGPGAKIGEEQTPFRVDDGSTGSVNSDTERAGIGGSDKDDQ